MSGRRSGTTVPVTRAILWDLDGVIVQSGPYHYRAYCEVLATVGRALAEDDYFGRLFGRRNYDILRAVLGDRPPEEIERLAREKEEAFRRLVRGHVRALPGADDLLHRAREAGLRQAIVSSTPRENVALVLSSLGVSDLLDVVVGEEDAARGKPDPEGFLVAAERLDVRAGGCVVIEDAPEGIAAGKAAGMRVIGVTTTRPAGRLTQADLVVPGLDDERVWVYVVEGGR